METAIVFVYHKDGKLRVLSDPGAVAFHTKLISDGWEHTATLDACRWIENLFNDEDNIEFEVRNLSIK